MLHVSLEDGHSLRRDEIIALYDSVDWSVYTANADTLLAALTGSHRVVIARDGERLVGLARSVSDGHTIAYVQDILVHPEAQRSGIGRALVERLLECYPGVRQKVLLTDTEEGQRAFYESLGFTEAHDMKPQVRAFVRFD